ncbi:MAG: hypothetical protein HDS23_05205 [Bacteroides sp.]|nr:hypothetical protein [Bacteroides sp.]
MSKLLILGGTYASLDIVKVAKSLGFYTIVTDKDSGGAAKDIADETLQISTTDLEALEKYIKENTVDGVFCGPSEFNLNNVINLCAKAGIRCYATPEQWEMCSNKETFKTYCKDNGVPTAPEYDISNFTDDSTDKEIEYPLIVKPVDGCSSKGITICYTKDDVLKAYDYAMSWSTCKRVVIEKYIDNGGSIFSFRYLIKDGEFFPYLMFDTYIADPINKKYLISAFTYFPSDLTETFYRDVDQPVRKMFKAMGLKNGTAFIQSIPYEGKIYCHEMGFRLSGGMIFKITEPMMGINDMKMMVRFAGGGEMITDEELAALSTTRSDKVMAQLMIPLDCGTIDKIEGLEEIKSWDGVTDFLQYYHEGDTVKENYMGTLMQHFGRFTLQASNKEEMMELVNKIESTLRICDSRGRDLHTMKFNTDRIK